MQQVLTFYQFGNCSGSWKSSTSAKSSNCSYSTLHTFTYKHTMEINKKQYTNHLKQKQKQQKTNLLVETIAWTERTLKTELKRPKYG
jgi:hypothetical protein